MRRLPPLNALRIFEVAARTGSYAEAGAELGLTHGAVSRQIAALEEWLGQRLFVRNGRRMMATPAAAFCRKTTCRDCPTDLDGCTVGGQPLIWPGAMAAVP